MNNIEHPSHYAEGRKYEPIDVIKDWQLNFNLGNTIKYISRAGRKNDCIEDLKKAKFYVDYELENMMKNDIKSIENNCSHLYVKNDKKLGLVCIKCGKEGLM